MLGKASDKSWLCDPLWAFPSLPHHAVPHRGRVGADMDGERSPQHSATSGLRGTAACRRDGTNRPASGLGWVPRARANRQRRTQDPPPRLGSGHPDSLPSRPSSTGGIPSVAAYEQDDVYPSPMQQRAHHQKRSAAHLLTKNGIGVAAAGLLHTHCPPFFFFTLTRGGCGLQWHCPQFVSCFHLRRGKSGWPS